MFSVWLLYPIIAKIKYDVKDVKDLKYIKNYFKKWSRCSVVGSFFCPLGIKRMYPVRLRSVIQTKILGLIGVLNHLRWNKL